MTDLRRRAQHKPPLSEATIESFWDGSRSGTAEECLRAACESHEALRHLVAAHEAALGHVSAELRSIIGLLGRLVEAPAGVEARDLVVRLRAILEGVPADRGGEDPT